MTSELQERLEQLEAINNRLRLKKEISDLEQQISQQMSILDQAMPHTSTPAGMDTHGTMPKSLLLDPMGTTPIRPRPRDLRWEDQVLPDSNTTPGNDALGARHRLLLEDMPDNSSAPDRFVTKRRRDKSPARGAMIKPAKYDGSGSWLDYKAHFETCSEINCWSYKEKGLYLAVALRGQAQGVFGNLASKSKDYDSLVNALEERFAPPNQTELYRVQLRERRQRATENLSELGQEIRRLTNLAYASAPSDVRETQAKEQFIDS